jgi:hypothetical protein
MFVISLQIFTMSLYNGKMGKMFGLFTFSLLVFTTLDLFLNIIKYLYRKINIT